MNTALHRDLDEVLARLRGSEPAAVLFNDIDPRLRRRLRGARARPP